jgi:hypothetical protein
VGWACHERGENRKNGRVVFADCRVGPLGRFTGREWARIDFFNAPSVDFSGVSMSFLTTRT